MTICCLAPPNLPPPVQHTPGIKLVSVVHSIRTPSVLRVRADCGGRVFPAKLLVVMHDLPHKGIDLLAAGGRRLLAASSATVFAIASITSSASAVSTVSEPVILFLNRGPKSLSDHFRADDGGTIDRGTRCIDMGWGRIGQFQVVDPNRRSVLRVRADCAGRFFRRNYSRADDGGTIDRGTSCIGQKRNLGDPSPALSDGCNGLRTRSLKPRRVAVSNVQPSHP